MLQLLSDLLKSPEGRKLLQQSELKAQQMLADPLVVQWRNKFPEVSDEELRLYMNRIYQYVKEYKQCSNCPGLDQCPNDLTGHYTMLTVENEGDSHFVHDHKVACKKWLSRKSQESIRKRITSFYIDDHALTHGYSTDEILTRDLTRAKAVSAIIDYILVTKEQGLQKKGMYLVGNFGTGKTFLMCYMLYELASEGLTGAIVYMPDFAEELKSMFSEPQKLKETIDVLKETDLLVLDDIGAENLNPWLRDHVIGTILNYRMNRKPTFFTSNYELNALEKHFSFTSRDGDEQYKGQRLMDRIRHFVDVVVVNGENKRGKAVQ